MVKDYPNCTFIFEWISELDSKVVVYDQSQTGLYLIGIRDVNTGELYTYKKIIEIANKYNVKATEVYNKTLDEILEDCKKYKSSEKEGFIIRLDNHFIKIKCDDYVNIVRLIQTTSSINTLIKLLADGGIDDILSNIPKEYEKDIQLRVDYLILYQKEMMKTIMSYFNKMPVTNHKDTMIWIQKNVPKWLIGYYLNYYTYDNQHFLKKEYGSEISQTKYYKLNDIEKICINLDFHHYQLIY